MKNKILTQLFLLNFLFLLGVAGNAQERSTERNLTTTDPHGFSKKHMNIENKSALRIKVLEKAEGSNNYLYLEFNNPTIDAINISWTVKDSNGHILAGTEKLLIGGGKKISGFDDATTNGGNMVILLENGISVKDLKLEIVTL
jgi:hypothetical protein